jgi:hypothetical protein
METTLSLSCETSACVIASGRVPELVRGNKARQRQKLATLRCNVAVAHLHPSSMYQYEYRFRLPHTRPILNVSSATYEPAAPPFEANELRVFFLLPIQTV